LALFHLWRLICLDFSLEGDKPVLYTHVQHIHPGAETLGEGSLARSGLAKQKHTVGLTSSVINEIPLSTSREVVFFDSCLGSILEKRALHNFDEVLFLVSFPYSLGVERLRSSHVLSPLLLSFDNFINPFHVILVCIKSLGVYCFELLHEHDLAHLLVSRLDCKEIFFPKVLFSWWICQLGRVFHSFHVTSVSSLEIWEVTHVIDVHKLRCLALGEKRHVLVAQPSLQCGVIAKLIYLN
jgi:hypothetical protein